MPVVVSLPGLGLVSWVQAAPYQQDCWVAERRRSFVVVVVAAAAAAAFVLAVAAACSESVSLGARVASVSLQDLLCSDSAEPIV